MSDSKSNPPKLAIWLLRHATPGDNEALTGDLIERFREGQMPAWFWRQVLIAFAVGVLGAVRRRWPYFCYAVAGVAMPAIFWKTAEGLREVLHWWVLPWPWSQIVFQSSGAIVPVLAALAVLAAGLATNQAFRSISLFRTAMINLTLVALGRFLLSFLIAFPWLLRPTADPHLFTIRFLPPPGLKLLSFFGFLVSAWLGCRTPQRASPAASL
jgi:hypothetical protein